MSPDRRRVLGGAGALAVAGALGACAAFERPQPWEPRLAGDTLALLGEVHDNREVHRRRMASLRRAVHAGWRPAIVMEQFDADRQGDIDRARRERPGDSRFLIEQATGGGRSGWDWEFYQPLIDLALAFQLPLAAGNLPRAEAMRLVREPISVVLGDERTRRLGLDAPLDDAWQAAQEREIDDGHCGALPRAMFAGMARAQAARDAQMAMVMREHATRGVVLIAGNGHVRRDLGVPRWLQAVPAARVFTVGFVERDTGTPIGPAQYDAVVLARREKRGDPCEGLRKRVKPPAVPPAASA